MQHRLIAHRGNVWGPDERENSPDFVAEAIESGFDAEVDLWINPSGIYFGHDRGKYRIQEGWIWNRMYSLWIHCKNVDALKFCAEQHDRLHYFWHDTDAYTLTSRGIVWTFPGNVVPIGGVLVDKNLKQSLHGDFEYICSDWVGEIRRDEGKVKKHAG